MIDRWFLGILFVLPVVTRSGVDELVSIDLFGLYDQILYKQVIVQPTHCLELILSRIN